MHGKAACPRLPAGSQNSEPPAEVKETVQLCTPLPVPFEPLWLVMDMVGGLPILSCYIGRWV